MAARPQAHVGLARRPGGVESPCRPPLSSPTSAAGLALESEAGKSTCF